jgi:hypothetical protein
LLPMWRERQMLTLYDFGNSVCCQKVRITLCAKGLDWEPINVDLFKAEQYDPKLRLARPTPACPAYPGVGSADDSVRHHPPGIINSKSESYAEIGADRLCTRLRALCAFFCGALFRRAVPSPPPPITWKPRRCRSTQAIRHCIIVWHPDDESKTCAGSTCERDRSLPPFRFIAPVTHPACPG